MTARRLTVLVQGLPADTNTAMLLAIDEGTLPSPQQQAEGQSAGMAKVRYLEDIPVAPSLREVGKFLNSSGDEFTQMAQQAG